MPAQTNDEPGDLSLLGLQDEMHMLRHAIQLAYDRLLQEVQFSEHLRFIATLSVTLPRVAALFKFEQQLAEGEEENAAFDKKFAEVFGDPASEE